MSKNDLHRRARKVTQGNPVWDAVSAPGDTVTIVYTGRVIPIDVSDTAWREPRHVPITLEVSTDTSFKIGHRVPTRVLNLVHDEDWTMSRNFSIKDAEEILTDLCDELHSRIQVDFGVLEYDSGGRPNKGVRQSLGYSFDSHYELLRASEEELLEIDGVGPALISSLYTREQRSCMSDNVPDWCVEVQCPECGEGWTAPFEERHHPRREGREMYNGISTVIGCPMCGYDTIPPEYVMGPRDFSPCAET
jgi:hypothetical protein